MCKQMTENDLREPNIWAQRLISLLLVLLGISFVGILILGSYYDQPITQSLSFLVEDNFRYDSGLNTHSFGDFQEVRFALPSNDYPDVWANSNFAYTPTALLPHFFAQQIQQWFGIQFSLWLYLSLLCLCVAFPAIFALRKVNDPNRRIASLLLLTVFATPFFATFDRGNSVGYAVPFLMIFASGFFYNKNWIDLIGVIGAFAIRPQFGLIGLAFLAARDIKKSITTGVIGPALVLGSFIFMPKGFIGSLKSWFANLTSFSKNYEPGGDFPVNLSLSSVFKFDVFSDRYSHLAILTITTVLFIFLIFRTQHDRGRLLIVTLSMTCLIPKVSFVYYSVFVLVIAAMIFTEPKFLDPPSSLSPESNARRQIKTRVAYNYLLITVVAISLAPIPFVREVGRNSIALESFSTLWTIVLVATLAQQIIEHYNAKVAA